MSLVVWLPLNGNLDNQGLSNVTVTNNGATVDNNGKIGKCYSFNGGTNSRIAVNLSNNLLTDQYSISCWVYIIAFSPDSDCRYIMTIGNASGSADQMIGFYLNKNNTITLNSEGNVINTGALSSNIWYHLVGTYDGTVLTFYLNGIKVNSITKSKPANKINLSIGSRSNATNNTTGAYYSTCKLNDVRVYDHCLSAKEVKELAKGLVLHYRLAGPGQENLVSNTSNKIKSANVTTSYNVLYSISGSQMEKGAKYVYSGYFENTGTKIIKLRVQWYNSGSDRGGPISSININPGDKGFYYLPFTYTSGTYNTFQLGMDGNSNTAITSSTYNYAFVKLERGSIPTPWCPNPADTLYAALGYNNNKEIDCGIANIYDGTKSGIFEYSSDTPRYSTSTKFNGNSYIYSKDINLNTNIWTMSCWYKRPSGSLTENFDFIACLNKDNGSDANKKIGIYFNKAKNKICYCTEGTFNESPEDIHYDQWTHCVVVNNGTKTDFYINGILTHSKTVSTNLTGCTNLVIGGRSANSDLTSVLYKITGNLSDFRIYATALSATDIAELYHTAAIVDNQNNMYAYEYVEEEVHS